MNKEVVVVIVLFVGFIVGLLWLELGQMDKYNTWVANCIRQAGVPTQIRQGVVTDRYECFVNSKIVDIKY